MKTSDTTSSAGTSILLLVLLIVAGVLALTACGNPSTAANTSTSPLSTPVATAPASAAAEQSAAGVGTIAFTGLMKDRPPEIYLVRTDGSGLKRLTHTKEGVLSACAWSPDGSRIAVASASASTVWVVNADGSGQHQVVPGGHRRPGWVSWVGWSPDGKQMVLATTESEDRAGLAVMDADGSRLRTLFQERGAREYGPPVWTPDGKIFFSHGQAQTPSGIATISSINADGSGLTDVTVLPVSYFDRSFSLSRDGRWLALFDSGKGHAFYMAANGHGREEVFLDGETMKRFTKSEFLQPNRDLMSVASSWSPDGTMIVFAGSGALWGSASPLYIVGIDGSGLREVPNTGLVRNPAWQPQ